MIVSDTLSRCPIDLGNDSDISDYIEEIQCFVGEIEKSRPISDKRLQQICKATDDERILQDAIYYTRFGWPYE